jgi:hypothetical protein
VRKWVIGSIVGVVAAVGLAFWLARPAETQGGEDYVAPRTPDGLPDLNGFWQAINTAEYDVLAHSPEWQVPAGLGIVEGDEIPYLPAALTKKNDNYAKRADLDPASVRCMMAGVPRVMYQPFPFQIVQTPEHIAMIFEYNAHTRFIYTDGTTHPEGYQAYMGDSRASWEGDTLVVDVNSFTGETWFDRSGNHHSDQLHVVERFTRTSPDVIFYEATIEDPQTFSRPWKISMPLYRRQEQNFRLLEYPCHALKDEEHHNRTGMPLTPGWHLRDSASSSFTQGGAQ